jgi:cyclin H
MLAALSLADRGLAERLITETFHYVAPPANNSGADTPASSGPDAPAPSKKAATRSNGEDRAQIIGSHIRDKVLGTIEACRDMLSKELPERREHWTNVCPYPFPSRFLSALFLFRPSNPRSIPSDLYIELTKSRKP